MNRIFFTGAGLVAALAAMPLYAGSCAAVADKPTALVELYTSQGCSSCPPADAWLAKLKSRYAGAGLEVVPLALHVPYWDYIGWKDRFAQPVFEARQRHVAASQRSATIYTPQITINGFDTPDWRRAGLDKALKSLATQPVLAKLALNAQFTAGAVQASVRASGPAGSRVVLVRYENGLQTQISAGENAGVRLPHDYVARDWVPLGQIPAGAVFRIERSLPARADVSAADSGLVLLLEDAASGRVLQALQLPAC